jgi:hypothetical protein
MMTEEDERRNNIVQIGISAAIALGLALITAFWSLADPRAEIKDIKSTYLTLREHEEFVTRFNADLTRAESNDRIAQQQMARKVDLDAHDRADDQFRTATRDRLDQMQRQIDLLISRSLIEPPPNVRGVPR